MKNSGGHFFVFYILFFSLFISCQTMPQTFNPLVDKGSAIPLEPAASVYLFADVQEARPVLEFIPIAELKDKQVQQIIDKTKSAIVGIYPVESGRQVQVSAWGSYPAKRGGLAFGLSKNWKKQRSATGYSYWHSAASRLSVAMSANQIYVAVSRTAAPVEPLGMGVSSPDGFNEFRQGSFLACWISNPASLIATLKLPLDLNIEQIFIGFSPFVAADETDSEEKTEYLCEAELRLEMAGTNEAKALMGMLVLARMFVPSMSPAASGTGPETLLPVLLANAPVLDDKSISIKTAPLSGKEVSLLFSFFSL